MVNKKLVTLAVTILATAGSVVVSPGSADAATSITVNSSGDVTVNGDNADQKVRIWMDESGNGHNAYVEVETNGVTNSRYVSDIRDMTIKTKGGNDTVSIGGYVSQEFRKGTIILGSGDNAVWMNRAYFSSNLRIIDSGGDADVTLWQVIVDGTTTISGGSGDTTIEARNGSWRKNVNISTASSGALDAVLEAQFSRGRFNLRGGNKTDRVELVGYTDFLGPLTKFDLKNGNDSMVVRSGVEFHSRVDIRGGGGHDNVFLFSNHIHERFTFDGGSGNDLFSSSLSVYESDVTFKGGSGTDEIDDTGNTYNRPPTIVSFEVG